MHTFLSIHRVNAISLFLIYDNTVLLNVDTVFAMGFWTQPEDSGKDIKITDEDEIDTVRSLPGVCIVSLVV